MWAIAFVPILALVGMFRSALPRWLIYISAVLFMQVPLVSWVHPHPFVMTLFVGVVIRGSVYVCLIASAAMVIRRGHTILKVASRLMGGAER
jgi:hypothetical protein